MLYAESQRAAEKIRLVEILLGVLIDYKCLLS